MLGVYCGDYQSPAQLTPLVSVGTGGFTLTDEIPEQYEPVVDNSIITGYRKITLNCSFYYDPNDENIVKLARWTCDRRHYN